MGPRGEVRGFNDVRFRTICDATTGRLLMLDAAARVAVYWVARRRQIRWYESAAPLRPLLHWTLSTEDRFVVHAGAVGDTRCGALIAGGSGSGKTSTALACLEAGMGYAGDDYVLLDVGGVPLAHSLFCTAKCDPPALRSVPGLLDTVGNPDRLDVEKAVLYLHPRRRLRLAHTVRVTALILPAVGARERPRLRRISPAEGLARLAPSSIFQLPHAGGGELRTMAELARRVPSFMLELGGDLGPVPGLVRDASETEAAVW